jgi:cyanophycin synthetase
VRGVLFDPGIDTAIVECTSEHILESGLAFDTSEISILTGSKTKKNRRNKEKAEVEKQCDLAVGRTTPSWGHLVLNADNDCDLLANDLYGQIAIYTTDPGHPALKRHCGRGRVAAYAEDEILVLQKGKWKTPLIALDRMRFAQEELQVQTALPAVLAAWLLNIDTKTISSALASFRMPAQAVQHEKA